MSTKTYYFSGEAYWAQNLKVPDKKYNADGFYQVNVILDDESWLKLKESGCMLEKRPIDGRDSIRFRRPHKKLIKGDVKELGAPGILDKEGDPYEKAPNIGNGSKVTCKVNVYDTMKGKGHTLEAVRVDDLIEYEAPVQGEVF